jgi:hypothetical protein
MLLNASNARMPPQGAQWGADLENSVRKSNVDQTFEIAQSAEMHILPGARESMR